MIPPGHEMNLNTIYSAAKNDALALLECTDAVTGKPVIVMCAVTFSDGGTTFTPLAKMFDGNPYDELLPPT